MVQLARRARSLWTGRLFGWHVLQKFRIQPLFAHAARKRSTASPFSLPPAIILQLTEACNLRCRMCYEYGETGQQSHGTSGRPAILPVDLVRRLMDDCRNQKTFYSLFGGEPLLYPHLEEVIRTAKRLGSCIETVTNGTLLSRQARMLVRAGADLVRISLDGPREINDHQRGAGSYDLVRAGLDELAREKVRQQRPAPLTGIICTVTPWNSLSLEQLFCKDLDLRQVDFVTLQMQSYLTPEMGRAYDRLVQDRFGGGTGTYWKGLVRSTEAFAGIDLGRMLEQVRRIRRTLLRNGIFLLLLPTTWSESNLGAYLQARWRAMTDFRGHCIAPWVITDVTARGELAPCHVFYDLRVGSLRDAGIRELWNGEAFRRFRGHLQSQLLPVCPACCQFYGYP